MYGKGINRKNPTTAAWRDYYGESHGDTAFHLWGELCWRWINKLFDMCACQSLAMGGKEWKGASQQITRKKEGCVPFACPILCLFIPAMMMA